MTTLGDVSAFTRFVPPNEYDVMLTDIRSEDLPQIAQDLDVTYLGEVPNYDAFTFPVQGIMHGVHSRLIIALPVKRRDVAVWVPFIVDTGAPYNYLSIDVMTALGFMDHLPQTCTVEIAGVRTAVAISRAHFECVNILGAQFLVKSGALLTVDYKADRFSIAKL